MLYLKCGEARFLRSKLDAGRLCIIVRFCSRTIQPFHCSLILFGVLFFFVSGAGAFPVGDAFDRGQAEFLASPEFHPRNDTPPVFHPSLHPNLNDEINEAHPIPKYIKKFSQNQNFPVYYNQLLGVAPEDQVQSKVFNEQAFRSIRRIGVLGFENKTSGPFRDENAGNVVAKQVSDELLSASSYFIIPPPVVLEDAQLKIVAKPPPGTSVPQNKEGQPVIPELPYSNEKVDAVIIGAVTKYMDTYRNREGAIEKSLASSVEFGAFLVSAQTGDVIWGARYVGSQPTGLTRFLLESGPQWMSKKQLSQSAMKNVLKAFRKNRIPVK